MNNDFFTEILIAIIIEAVAGAVDSISRPGMIQILHRRNTLQMKALKCATLGVMQY